MEEEETVRLRVIFSVHRHLLSRTQKSEEKLNRSWVLLKPTHHKTISDLSCHITHIFNLTHSCPYGISLFMDDFVLPPFESTCILKDKDLIRVKRNKGSLRKIVEVGSMVNSIECEEVENKHVGSGILILANGDFEKENRGHESELEEKEENIADDSLVVDNFACKNAGSKKRKGSKKHQRKRVKRRGETSVKIIKAANGEKKIGGEVTVEKQSVKSGMLLLANEEFEKETSCDQSKFLEKEDNLTESSLLVSAKKRKASKEITSTKKKRKHDLLHKDFETNSQVEQNGLCHSPKRKKEKRSMAHQEIESDFQFEQNEPGPSCGLPSEMNCDDKEEMSNFGSKLEKDCAERNDECIGPVSSPERLSIPHDNGIESVDVARTVEVTEPVDIPQTFEATESVDVPQTSQVTEPVNVPQTSETKKKISKSARRIYAKRQWKKEVKAEAKELLAENILLFDAKSPENDMDNNSVEHQQHNQSDVADGDFSPVVIRPGHIRFELLENDQDVQQSRVVVETFQSIGITSKRKNRKWGKDQFVYCTRSKCRDSNEKCLQVVTMEKAKPQNESTLFDKLPLLTSCPKEGDVIAYRVLEKSSNLEPVLSSFRIGKTLRLDKWTNTLLLTPVEEDPATSKNSDKGAWEQQPDKSVDTDQGYLEIDINALFDVRIVKTAPIPDKDVNVWDALSQATSVKNALLIRKKDWGKSSSTATSSKKEWGLVGPTTSSWGPPSSIATSTKKDRVEVDANTSSWKEWNKASSSVGPPKEEWGKVGPTISPWKAWGNVSSTTSSWLTKPAKNVKRSRNGFPKGKRW